MKLTIVGSGDAFGSGGRPQTCYHVAAPEGDFLIDCGVTALIGMQKLGLDPDRVRTIFVSHLHGDHFGGLIWFLLHAHYVTGRTAPLAVYGPTGTAERFNIAAEALYPNSTQTERRFEMTFHDLEALVPVEAGGVRVTPFEVLHPSGATPYALRLECAGKVLSFSGDTRWVENLIPCAQGSDLFICESFGFEAPSGYHMSWQDLRQNIDRLGARRVLLTHMGPAMLAHRDQVRDDRVVLADDGMVIEL